MPNTPGDNARNKLLELERRRQLAVVSEFEKIQTRLESEINDLLKVIEKERRIDGNASPASLFQKARLGQLLDQVTAEIKDASARLAGLTESAQNSAIDVAENAAAQYPQLKADLVTFDAGATRSLVGLAGNGQPLAVHFAKLAAPARQAMFDALFFGVAAGVPNQAIAREVKDAIGGTTAQAMTIVRTETNRSYREATREFYTAAPSVVGWRWLAALDLNCCPICWSQHGRIFKTKTKFGTHPNCLLPGTIVNSPRTLAATKRRYSGQVVEIITAFGRRLAVTANHPILTPAGWAPAQFLNQGGDIVGTFDGKRAMSVVNPHKDNKPTRIQQIFKAFDESGGVSARHMEVTAEDFHGDGSGGNVDIIFPDGLLPDGFNPAFNQPGIEDSFVNRFDAGVNFSRLCPVHQFTFGAGRSAHCFMGRGDIAGMFGGGPAVHHQTVGVGFPANIDAGGFQDSPNDVSRMSDLLGKGIFGPAGNVEFYNQLFIDRIISLRHSYYEGNVYNVETSAGFYAANGIINHNCRCTMVPVFKNDAKQPTGPELFAKLNEAQQRTIVGPRRLDLYRQGAELSDFIETNKSAFGIGRQMKPIVRTTFKPDPRELIPASVERLPAPKPVLPVVDRTTPKPALKPDKILPK